MKALLQKPNLLTQPLFFSFVAWALEITTLFLVFAALGYVVLPSEVIIVRSIAGNIESQGYAFAGYAQIVATSLYTSLGIQTALAASVALLGGIVIFWLKTALSYVAFYFVVLVNYAKKISVTIPSTEKTAETSTTDDLFSKDLLPKEKTGDKG
jgi:hypothetical protein